MWEFCWDGKKWCYTGLWKKIVSALQMEKDISHAQIVATAQIFSMQLEVTYVMNKDTIIEKMLDGLQNLLIKY